MEKRFVEYFLKLIDFADNQKDLVQKLQIKEFITRVITFTEFLNVILCHATEHRKSGNKYIKRVYDLTKRLLKNEKVLDKESLELFIQLLSDSIAPIELNVLDNETCFEIKGNNFFLTEAIEMIQDHPLFKEKMIQEVRIISKFIMFVDCDLPKEVWHGVTVFVWTHTLKVLGSDRVWDCSGYSSTHKYENDAGIDGKGNGIDGKDGYAGESGGNILIKAEDVKNGIHLKVISNGGAGSDGQNGGSGKDGKNGTSARISVLKQFKNSASCNWNTGRDNFNDAESTARRLSPSGNTFCKVNRYKRWGDGYIQTTLSSGLKVTYVCWHLLKCLCLVQGSNGTPGGKGGNMGFGGEGGFAGNVHVPEKSGIKTQSSQASHGEDGQGGYFGSNGVRGSDIGFYYWHKRQKTWLRALCSFFSAGITEIVYAASGNVPGSIESTKYGESNSQYLEIRKCSNGVWSPYTGTVEISAAGYKENYRPGARKQNTSRQTRERQRHASARKQVAINELAMINNYKELFSDEARKSAIESLSTEKQEKETIDEEQEQDLQINVTVSAYEKMPDSIKDKIVEATKVETLKCTSLIAFPELELLQAKYKALEKIGSIELKINNFADVSSNNSKFLIISPNNVNETNESDIINDLNQEILSRKDFLNRFHKNPFSKMSDVSIAILREFINEMHNNLEQKDMIAVHYNRFKHYIKESTEAILAAYCTLESALKPFPELQNLFKNCSDEIFKEAFEEQLKELKNSELQKQYDSFIRLQKRSFDWSTCFKDKLLTNRLLKHLDTCTVDCPTYIETVAQLYNVNIRCYSKSGVNDGFDLQRSFNSSVQTMLHLVKKNNRFYELSFDEDAIKLNNYRHTSQLRYKKIMHEIENCTSINEVKLYLNDGLYEKEVEADAPQIDDLFLYNFVSDHDKSFIYNLCKHHLKQDERDELQEKLEKMVQLGASSTLHYLSDRLRMTKDSQISVRDIHLVINTTFVHADKYETFTFLNWILVSQPPETWTTCFAIYRLEDYLGRKLENDVNHRWKSYLMKVVERNIIVLFCLKLTNTEKHALDMEKLNIILFLLSVSNPDPVAISNLKLQEWAFVLKEFYWKYKLQTTVGWNEEDEYFQKAVHLLLKIENQQQFTTTNSLINAFQCHDLSEDSTKETVITIFKNIADEAWSISDSLLKIIQNNEITNWIEPIHQIMPSSDKERTAEDLIKIIRNRMSIEAKITNTELNLAQNRILDQIDEVSTSIMKVHELTNAYINYNCDHIRGWSKDVRKKKIAERKSMIEEMFAMINIGVKLWSEQGFTLRDTQLLASLIIIKHEKNTLLQVSTGEGKSLIVAAVAITRVLLGTKVDIITTSSVLAQRDVDELAPLYDMFGITVGHNTDMEMIKRQVAYKVSDVVYGDLPCFQRDYLLDKFYGNNVMSGRSFDNVLVDEVDSMLLDRGNNTLYLSHEIPELDKLEAIYLHIWTRIVMGKTNVEESSAVWNTDSIAREVLTSLYGLIDPYHLRKVYRRVDPDLNQRLLKHMLEKKIINEHNCVISTKIDLETARNILNKEAGDDSLLAQLKELIHRRKQRIITEDDIVRLTKKHKIDGASIYQTLKDDRIINNDGQIIKDETCLNQIRSSLNSYSGIMDIVDPLVNLLKKLMRCEINTDDLYKIQTSVLDEKCQRLHEILQAEGIIDKYGHIRLTFFERRGLERKLLNYEETKIIISPLMFLIQKRIERDSIVTAPRYLTPFILDNLKRWIENAKLALYLKDQEDYVVDKDRSGTDGGTVVTILDKDTGTDQTNSQWDTGLHQFIQLKHGCRLTTQSLKAVFVSNVSYFKLYKHLNGLSGTLGSDVERQHLVESHDVDFLTLPTFKQKQFQEFNPFVLSTTDDWQDCIFDQTIETLGKKRSVLIICEIVEMVEELSELFAAQKSNHGYEIRTYTRDYEKLDVIHEQKKLLPGFIIIATNLAGRGTDIKLSDELIRNGGLHVILSYLSANDRIEQQAMGRAARKGDPGSGQLIIYSTDFNEKISNHSYKMLKLRSQRRLKEADHVSMVRQYYEDQIQLEEKCFKMFRDTWDSNTNRLQKEESMQEEHRAILKRGILDKWAFWLDNHIGHGRKVDKEYVMNECTTFLQKIECLGIDKSQYCEWIDDLAQLVILGKSMIGSDNDLAKSHFDKVIAKEPEFCEMAHYYIAHANVNKSSGNIEDPLRKALKLFEKRKDYASMTKALIANLKQYTASLSSQSKSFEEQQVHVYSIYDAFVKSVYDIIGHHIDPSVVMEYSGYDSYCSSIAFKLLCDKSSTIGDIKLNTSAFDGSFNKYCDSMNVSYEGLRKFINAQGSSVQHLYRLRNEMKEQLEMPCREEFWIYLELAEVITDTEIIYHLPKDKLREIEPGLLRILEKSEIVQLSYNEMFLYPEYMETGFNAFVISKEGLEEIAKKSTHEFLFKNGCLFENRYGRLDRTKMIDIDFECFNSIKENGLASPLLNETESKKILDSLVRIGILTEEPSNKIYKPTAKFYSFDFTTCDTTIPEIFHDWILQQLSNAFAYRVAYFKLCTDVLSLVIHDESDHDMNRMLESLCQEGILVKSCLDGYLLQDEVSMERIIDVTGVSDQILVQKVADRIVSTDNQQSKHFKKHHNSSLKIGLTPNLADTLLGQMVARGIITRQKIIHERDKTKDYQTNLIKMKDIVSNALKPIISIKDLREFPSVEKYASEVGPALDKDKVIQLSADEYEMKDWFGCPLRGNLPKEYITDTAENYIYHRKIHIASSYEMEKLSKFIYEGRGTLNIYDRFDIITKTLSECTSLKAKTEERQFFINGADTVLIGQEKPEKPSIWGWILGIVLSVITIVVGVVLCCLGMPFGGLLIGIGINILIYCSIGLSEANKLLDEREQKERVNAETISTFLKHIQTRINRMVPRQELSDEEHHQIQRKISVEMEKSNLMRKSTQFESILKEAMNIFESDIYKILDNEVKASITNKNLQTELNQSYHIYDTSEVDREIDDEEEFHIDSDRLTDIIAIPFTSFNNYVVAQIINGADVLEINDLDDISSFKNSLNTLFMKTLEEFHSNKSEIYQAILEELIDPYVEDLHDLRRRLEYTTKPLLEDVRHEIVKKRLEHFRVSIKKSVMTELNKVKSDSFEKITVVYSDKIKMLAEAKLVEIASDVRYNVIRANKADVRGLDGLIIQNISLTKNEYHRLMSRKSLIEKINRRESYKQLSRKLLKELEHQVVASLISQKFKNVINDNQSSFYEVLQLENSDILFRNVIEQIMIQPKNPEIIESLSESLMHEHRLIQTIFSENNARYSRILEKLIQIIQYANAYDSIKNKEDLFKYLVLSSLVQVNTISNMETNEDEPEHITLNGTDISFSITEDKIIFAGSSSYLSWCGLHQIMTNVRDLLQKAELKNVSKAVILKTSNEAPSTSQILSYLKLELEDTDSVVIFSSNGQIQKHQRLKDAKLDEILDVKEGQILPFYVIELLYKIIAALPYLVFVANYCEKDRRMFEEMYKNKLKEFEKELKRRNIFTVVHIENPDLVFENEEEEFD